MKIIKKLFMLCIVIGLSLYFGCKATNGIKDNPKEDDKKNVPEGFVLVDVTKDGIIGKNIDYDVPGDDEDERTWNKGVFVQGRG